MFFYVKKVKKRVFFVKKVVFYPQKSVNIDPILVIFDPFLTPCFIPVFNQNRLLFPRFETPRNGQKTVKKLQIHSEMIKISK